MTGADAAGRRGAVWRRNSCDDNGSGQKIRFVSGSALATLLLTLTSIHVVILFDLTTFAIAFLTLFFAVRIPRTKKAEEGERESVWQSTKSGLRYLRENRGILDLMLFLAVINFTASQKPCPCD